MLRRWDLNGVLTGEQSQQGVNELLARPLRVVHVRGLFADARAKRANVTFADGLYVALAAHLHASLLTSDGCLANAPTLGVPVLYSA
ncbi:hypothetical protein K6U06_07210 [Acidiferrimicrobium sp. IK]|uniref:hypothetical protein n=1 Tax=Acidiferrimicrobium sp. IK TaxID=2871700 RepID=UPI0021CB1C8E|nr:hypothetical protein [Acidiferrimicrobium sp. IK]MCU4184143.1 hypothetical protein [Acidiferrimicrobium sp. IK]